jgi:ABC-2 type transport system permease protein
MSRRPTTTGVLPLARLVLRRDRVRLPIWIVSVTLLVLFTAASVKGLYRTEAELVAGAAPMYGNAAVIALNGPTYAIDTYGGQMAFQIGSFGYVVMALMGMFLVGRHTRADEEDGRTELIRATVVGRNAPVTAVLVVAALAYTLLGALITLAMLSQDVAVEGSILFGVAMGAFGMFFACLTAVTAQVTEHNRAALGLAGVVLGVSYVLRAIGDVSGGALSWLSPMGWAQYTKPFAGDHWWPLLLIAFGSAALVLLAYRLQASRDIGAGLLQTRPGPPTAAPSLGRPDGLALRLQWASFIGWALALALTGVAYGSVAQDVADLVGDNDTLEELIAQAGGSLVDSFFATSLLILALITGGFAVAATMRLRSEETAGRAEPLLATALPRTRWALSHLLVALAGSALIGLAAGLGMGLTDALTSGSFSNVPSLIMGSLAFAPALWVLVGIAFALFGVQPRAMVAAWGALGAFFVIGMFGVLFKLPSWVIDLSPFQHVPAIPAQDFSAQPLIILTAVAAGLVGIGLFGFRRRDVS